MDRLMRAASLAMALVISACSGGQGAVGTADATSGNAKPTVAAIAPRTSTAALFQPLQGILPYPTDLYFAGSTDGTLNIQPGNALAAESGGHQRPGWFLDDRRHPGALRWGPQPGLLHGAIRHRPAGRDRQCDQSNYRDRPTAGIRNRLHRRTRYRIGRGQHDSGNPADTPPRPQYRHNQQRLLGLSDEGDNRRQRSRNHGGPGLRQHPGGVTNVYSHY